MKNNTLVYSTMVTLLATMFSQSLYADKLSDERLEKQKRYLEMRERERAEKKRQQDIDKHNKGVKERNCQRARDQLRQYTTSTALYDIDKNGKKVYLDKKQRKQAEKDAAANVKKYCR